MKIKYKHTIFHNWNYKHETISEIMDVYVETLSTKLFILLVGIV